MRFRTPRTGSAAALVGALALASLAVAVALAPIGAPAAAARPYVGQMLHPFWDEGTQMTRQLEVAERSGAQLVRADVSWSSLQVNGPSTWDGPYLHRIDRFVSRARAHGIRVLFTVMSSPCWASTAPESLRQDCAGAWWNRDVQYWAPHDVDSYARAVNFLARRYRGRVAAWEIWNEPDLPFFWNVPPGETTIGRYVDLVRAAYPAIKRADPRTTVLAGSTSGGNEALLRSMYAAGLRGSFDGLAIHPYNGRFDPQTGQWRGCQYTFRCAVPRVRALMVANGDAGKSIWLTEMGWSTCSDRSADHQCVTARQQARFLRRAFAMIRRWPYVRAAVWYEARDETTDPVDRNSNFGLVTHDYRRKPAFAAFRAVARGR